MKVVKNEPVVTAAVLASAIVTILNVFGVVVDVDTVTNVIIAVVTIVAALGARSKVSPVVKLKELE